MDASETPFCIAAAFSSEKERRGERIAALVIALSDLTEPLDAFVLACDPFIACVYLNFPPFQYLRRRGG